MSTIRFVTAAAMTGWVFSLAGILLSPAAVTGAAASESFPSRPLRIVSGPVGGSADFLARMIAQRAAPALGQNIIVDNRPPALIGEIVSKSPPDGHTLLIVGGSFWVNSLFRKTPYDPVADFAPVTLVTRTINMLAVHPSVTVKSVQELIALAKEKPGQLNYASSDVGGTAHLATELFKYMAGVNFVNVPYKGNALGITALIGGEVQLMVAEVGSLMPHVKSGKVRALAVTSAQPTAIAPGMPTIAASGLPGYESVSMTGTVVPARTPAAIINRLNQEIVRVVTREDAKEQLRGAEIIGGTPAEFLATIKTEVSKWSKLIKATGMKAG